MVFITMKAYSNQERNKT